MYNSTSTYNPSDGTSKRFSIPIVQELASQNLQSLPERYIRPEEEHPNEFPPPQIDIPIIDIGMFVSDSNDLSRQKELEKLGIACQQWGFFQAVNHGVPLSLMERMKEIVREFIKLPLEEKLKYKIQESEGYGQAFVGSDDQVLDWADTMSLNTLPPETTMFNSTLAYNPSDGTSKRFSIPIVQELASQNLQSLPERYIRPEEERPNEFPPPQIDIPIIDIGTLLSDSNDLCRQKELEKLGIACQQWGFFQAVNHGVPLSLMERTKEIVREFIKLPLEEKLKYKIQESEGYGQAFVGSDDQVLDWADMMSLNTLPLENRKMDLWPKKPADFRETVDQYAFETQKLGNTVLRLLSENAGLKPDRFINACGKIIQRMRMNYYPPCPRPDLALGLSSHSDGNILTVLLQDDETVGLQICKDGQWIPVQSIPKQLEVLSNGIYRSAEHRAVTNMDKDRISIAMFYGPSMGTEVGPVPELIDEMHPCQYRRFIRAEYMNFFSRKLEGKKKKIEFVKIKS